MAGNNHLHIDSPGLLLPIFFDMIGLFSVSLYIDDESIYTSLPICGNHVMVLKKGVPKVCITSTGLKVFGLLLSTGFASTGVFQGLFSSLSEGN